MKNEGCCLPADSQYSAPVLLIDDEPHLLQSSSVLLRSAGIGNVMTINDSRDVMPFLQENAVAVIVLDLMIPHLSGKVLLDEIIFQFPRIPVIVMTALGDVDTAVECTKAGAFDYLVKPVEKDRFITSVMRALEFFALRREVLALKSYLLDGSLKYGYAFSPIVTNSKKMQAIFRYVEAVAISKQPVLITGETGVGKELIARAIHDISGRKSDFVAVNISGLDDAMFSDTLFGHKKGAYTGAEQEREGLIVRASGGTLFLDEIGDINEASQVKLLRLLQEGVYYQLGSDSLKHSNARMVVATNHDLCKQINADKFRKDLYYRLCAHHVHIPPLRERREDVLPLFHHFLGEAAESLGKKVPTLPPQIASLLSTYHFPGNVRELRSMVFDAVVRHEGGMLSMDSFKEVISKEKLSLFESPPLEGHGTVNLKHSLSERFPTLREAEDYLIAEALKLSDGNQGIAASLLGITRQALNSRLKRKNKDADSRAV